MGLEPTVEAAEHTVPGLVAAILAAEAGVPKHAPPERADGEGESA